MQKETLEQSILNRMSLPDPYSGLRELCDRGDGMTALNEPKIKDDSKVTVSPRYNGSVHLYTPKDYSSRHNPAAAKIPALKRKWIQSPTLNQEAGCN